MSGSSCQQEEKKKLGDFIARIKRDIIEYEYYSEGNFEYKVNKGCSTIWLFKVAVFRIRELKNRVRLEIKNGYLKHCDLESEVKFLKSDLLWSEIPFNDYTISKIQKNMPLVLEQCYLEGAVEIFGCCDRYVECSDNKACVHPDIKVAKGCMYKKNLDKGRIFYGENA